MKIRWQKNVFVRHVDDESVVWCPRTGGCTVMRNVQPFLEEIQWEWRDELDVDSSLAEKFGCSLDAVSSDARMVFDELISQGFVEKTQSSGFGTNLFDQSVTHQASAPLENTAKGGTESDDGSPLGNFCARHGIPTDFHLDLTDACTERCVHCYVPRDQRDFLSFELVEKAWREFLAMNGLTVHLTGGEAMLHPDFERICRLCVELNLNFVIFSNMTLCDAKRIAFLKEVDPQFINVSLYSMDAAVHDSITQLPGSWQKTMNALLACEKAGVHCRIATPLLKENQDALSELRKFADEHHLHLVPSADIVAQADHGCRNLSHACSVEELRRVLLRDRRFFHKTYNGEMPSSDAKVCDIGEGRLYLNAKGDYYPCDCMHEYVLGNVREQTVEDIWKGDKLNYLRSLKNRDFGACASCEKRPWCKVCPAANFNATRDLFTHHPNTCALAGVVREVYGNQR